MQDWPQMTLTVRGRITVRLVSSLTKLDLTKNYNMWLLAISEAVEYKHIERKTGDLWPILETFYARKLQL